MVRLSVSSNEKARQRSPFLNPEYAGFHREACEQLSPAGVARVYMLYFRGEPAAFLYGFVYHKKFYAFQTGYDAIAGAFSPGDVVFQMACEHLIGERMEEFDYLRGGEEYKSRFGDLQRCTETTLLFRRADHRYVGQWIRSNLAGPARHRVKQWLAGSRAP
jgi:CelD/BcsL family acetyltransferase involved in cellulose biosynthesis